MSAPSSVSDSSTAASAAAMSKTSNQPMWPMRKIFPLSVALARRERDAVPVAQVAQELGAVDAVGRRATAVTTADESSSGEKSSSPIALTPARVARPSRTWRSNAASSPSSRIIPSATSSPRISDTAGVKAASKTSCAFCVARQSK